MEMDEGSKLHLKEWLLAQVDSGAFEGLCWHDSRKTMVRIPWKHAAKKDYKQTEDAALFKAWALHKGKHREGQDRANPSVWKTRLRCALNKSTDFQVVPELCQQDVSEPYKVYRIWEGAGPTGQTESAQTKYNTRAEASPRSPACPETQQSFEVCKEREGEERDGEGGEELDVPIRDHIYCEMTGKKVPLQHFDPLTFCSSIHSIANFTMQVTFLYQGRTVLVSTTTSPDGCFILQGRGPVASERIYGPCTAQQLSFPPASSLHMSALTLEAINRLLCHLERGVLIWVAPDGVFIKRFCQCRVYWSGPAAQHTDRPNKLEREKTFKLLDNSTFLNDLHRCLQGKGTPPLYSIELCFGEEYPDPTTPKTQKLVMVQVVPMFAVDLLERFSSD
ncbi:interferon regulatory factor 4-like [Entelurus aequoreus]|uniref:interferon regulatory factor 4-like n=1 Tax=Entelurus aequoreus TaxID=161455 RepID=UPI002B1D6854|nr:interferon regulatory factor 4-like [Entelurus aequoreus]XP_061908684.1 interferon regulatory factor 4-like [Entelurus aequoreus]